MGPVGICAIFKDEAEDLLEWIAYHLSIGFDHIVLFDNGSVDGGAARVSNSPFAGFVTIIDWPERPGQLSAYRHFCQHMAMSFEWVAFIDIDEFVHPLEDDSIKAVLPRYGSASGVLVEWLVFGPSGHVERPTGLVIENYDIRLPEDHPRCGWVKSILRVADIVDVRESPHVFDVSGKLCNTRGEWVPAHAWIHPCHDVLVLNHYFTKSQEDWDTKTARGAVILAEGRGYYRRREFEEHANAATERDDRIQRFVPLVKQVLARGATACDIILSHVEDPEVHQRPYQGVGGAQTTHNKM